MADPGTLISLWLLPALLGSMWLLCAASNAVSLFQAYRFKQTTSLTLFLGGIFGVLAVLALPVPNAWRWCWLPPLLDAGSIPALIRLVILHRAANKPPPHR